MQKIFQSLYFLVALSTRIVASYPYKTFVITEKLQLKGLNINLKV